MANIMMHFAVVLAVLTGVDASKPDLDISVYAQTPTHVINELFLGCHSDSGYGHAPRGFYSQLIFDESFEATNQTDGKENATSSGWHDVYVPSVGSVARDTANPLNGWASRKLTLFKDTASTAAVGVVNRGLGNEGLFLEAKKEYEGYLFARADQDAVLTVALEDATTSPPTTLASANLSYTGQHGAWQMLNFSALVPAAGTACDGIAYGSDPSVDCGADVGAGLGHVCVRCGGQLVVALASPGGDAHVDFVHLQPGK